MFWYQIFSPIKIYSGIRLVCGFVSGYCCSCYLTNLLPSPKLGIASLAPLAPVRFLEPTDFAATTYISTSLARDLSSSQTYTVIGISALGLIRRLLANILLNPFQVKGKDRPTETTNSYSRKKDEGKTGIKRLPSGGENDCNTAFNSTCYPPEDWDRPRGCSRP